MMEYRERFPLGDIGVADFIRVEHVAEKVFVDYDISMRVQYYADGEKVGGEYDCLSERAGLCYAVSDRQSVNSSEETVEVIAAGGSSESRLRNCVNVVGEIFSGVRK